MNNLSDYDPRWCDGHFCPKDCDCWNDWDSAGRESLGNYVCSCAHWTVEDGAVFYTKPTDFCSYGEKREES